MFLFLTSVLLTQQGQSLAINLPDQSLCLFDGRKILHETTPQQAPNRLTPKRISLVYFRCVGKRMDLQPRLTFFKTKTAVSVLYFRHRGLSRPHHGQNNGGPDSKTAAKCLSEAAQACRCFIQQEELNQRERNTLSLMCSAIVDNLS